MVISEKLLAGNIDVMRNKLQQRHRTQEMHLDLQLIHLLFTEASSEVVSMEEGILKEGHQGEKTDI